MRINRALNMVVPIDADDGATIYVHSMPISREVFEKYFLVLSKTFAALIGQGLSVISGPRAAYLMLKRLAEEMGEWDGRDGVESGLLAEIRRLTNVVVPSPAGWRTIPYQEAVATKVLDPEDAAEVDGLLCFFTCISTIPPRNQRQGTLDGMGSLWGVRSESSNCTDFAASLPTSTGTDSFGETVPISSVPS